MSQTEKINEKDKNELEIIYQTHNPREENLSEFIGIDAVNNNDELLTKENDPRSDILRHSMMPMKMDYSEIIEDKWPNFSK